MSTIKQESPGNGRHILEKTGAMDLFAKNFLVSLPLFLIIGTGWLFGRTGLASRQTGSELTRFAFALPIPLVLFRQMSRITALSMQDFAAPLVFFATGLALFCILRPLASSLLGEGREGKTILAMAGIYANTVLIGIPMCEFLVDPAAMPALSLVFALNAFLWWTLVTVLIGFSRAEGPSPLETLARGTANCMKSPVTAGMLLGAAWSLTGLPLPDPVDRVTGILAGTATPVALFAVGVSLAQYRITSGLAASAFVCVAKLAACPLLALAAAAACGLDRELARGIFLLSALPVGVNVFVMAEVFQTGERAVTNALVITTVLASVTVPLLLTVYELLC